MIDKVSKKILKLLSAPTQSEEQKEILLFGITRIVEDIPKTVGVIIIGLILGIIKEMAIVTVIVILYKTLTGGVHAKTNWGCFAYSVIFYLLIIYSAKFLILDGIGKYAVYVILYIFSLYTIFVYVPADVPEIPKVNLKLRKILKIKALVMLNIIYIITIFFITSTTMQNLIIYSVFFIGVMTTRTIYNLFKAEYGFETYIPDELI